MAFWNRKYKDSVFTDLFGTDKTGKENFLALYNALSGNDYKLKEVSLERKVIEQSLYKTFNNDVSWEINGKLIVLVEHPSTVNENMPFRCLEYVTRIYEKDNSKLELVVKVKNCSDSKLLPLVKTCDILKEYCRFIEIVELNFDKRHPRRSFQKAIEQAMEEGILVDYLDRKSREVINMLCAKYDYKLDIAVKKEEAFQDGLAEGAQQKTLEDARSFYANGASIELIAKSLHMTEEQVREIVSDQIEVKA